MVTDAEIAFLNAQLDEDEAMVAEPHIWPMTFRPERVLREVALWRRLILDFRTAPLDATYGGTERETGFRLALSAALKAKIATYEDNPVTGEPFPDVAG